MRPEILFLIGVLAVAFLSMAVFATLNARRGPASSQHTAQRGTFALGGWIREWFYWAIRPVERPIDAFRIPPEVFNALGILIALGSMAAFMTGHLPLGGYLILASGLADVLDGVAARVRGVVSRYGAFLDSTLDRFAEAFVFVGLAVYYDALLPTVWVLFALSGSLLVSYTRARGEGLGVQCKVGILQRAERMLLLGLGAVLDPTISAALGREPGAVLLPVIGVIAVGSMGTAVFRTYWICRKLLEEGDG